MMVLNFISTLNPKSKYDRLTGSIKTLGGGAIFNPESGGSTHGGASTGGRSIISY